MSLHRLDRIDESNMSGEDIYLQRKLLEWQATHQHDAAHLHPAQEPNDTENTEVAKEHVSAFPDQASPASRSPSYPPLPDTPEEQPSLKDYRTQLQRLDEANYLRLRAAREQRDRENEAARNRESHQAEKSSPDRRDEQVGARPGNVGIGGGEMQQERHHAPTLVAVAVVVLLACFPVLFVWSFR